MDHLIVACVATLLITAMYTRLPDEMDMVLRVRARKIYIWCCVLAIWPYVYHAFASHCCKYSMVAFLWPFVIATISNLQGDQLDVTSEKIHLDTNVICGIVFTLVSFSGVSNCSMNRKLLIAPLVTYLLFVVPRFEFNDQLDRVSIETVQTAVFTLITSLIICGIIDTVQRCQ